MKILLYLRRLDDVKKMARSLGVPFDVVERIVARVDQEAALSPTGRDMRPEIKLRTIQRLVKDYSHARGRF